MKVLFLHTHNQSFLASFYYELAINLKEEGQQVLIFSLKKSVPTAIPDIVKVDLKTNRIGDSIKIFNIIKSFKPEIIISSFSYVNPALLSGKLLGVKQNVVWFHTLTEQLNASRKQLFIKSFFLNLASKIIVNSSYLKEDLIKNYNINSEKIYSIPFWTTVSQPIMRKNIQESKSIFKIGCPGRIEEVKNQEIILEGLTNQNFDFEVYFAGTGTKLGQLREKSRKILNSDVHFLGVLSKSQMLEFYTQMNLIVLPSKFEAFGLVFIEALALGCPVLVSNKFGALTYIKDEEFKSKYTFDPSNVEDFKLKLKNIREKKSNNRDYFKSIYKRFFKKSDIINQVKAVINT